MAIILALLAGVMWGTADFAGGSASRRKSALFVVAISQVLGLIVIVIVAMASQEFSAPLGYLPWAVLAGLFGTAGLVFFYRGLAVGTMGVVSPISALGVVVPITWGLVIGQWPTALTSVGIILAIVGVVAASGPERSHGAGLKPILLASAAAVCFGLTLPFIAAGASISPIMTMVGMRTVSIPALVILMVVLAVIRGRSADRLTGTASTAGDSEGTANQKTHALSLWITIAVAGIFDIFANLTFAYASALGALTIVAILGSLYPAVTVVLARIIHAERLKRIQQIGVAIALAGVAIISAGS